LVNNIVYSSAIDGQGNKWFGTKTGISKFDDISWTTYTKYSGLANNCVQSIAIDAQNNKWFGTWGGGISKFDGTSWVTYDTTNGLSSNNVLAIAIDAKGNKWIGTYDKGVTKFDGTNWNTYSTTEGLVTNTIYSIAFDVQGNEWFGTDKGVLKMTDKKLDIESIDNNEFFNLFPNPATNTITIQTGDNAKYVLKLNNLQGQTVITKNVTFTNSYSLDLSSIDNGIYFLTLQNEKEQVVRKVVVQK